MKNYLTYWAYMIYYHISFLFAVATFRNTFEVSYRYLAFRMHHKVRQRYNDKYPYYYHIKMVTDFVIKFKHLLSEDDFHTAFIIACFHDAIEDCRLTYNDGEAVADGVFACTDLRGKNRKDRHGPEFVTELQENRLAIFAKLCDVCANMTMGKMTGSRMLGMYQKDYAKTKKDFYRNEFDEIFDYMEYELVNI